MKSIFKLYFVIKSCVGGCMPPISQQEAALQARRHECRGNFQDRNQEPRLSLFQ